MRSHLRTPLIVDVDKTPEEYIQGLNKPAKKNYKAAMKAPYTFRPVNLAREPIEFFMKLWSGQIGGQWAFGPEYFFYLMGQGWLDMYGGFNDNMDLVAILPMERFDDFKYAQPVMYNKTLDPEVAKFMWFSMLTEACSDSAIENIDLGGGFNGSWDQFIKTRGVLSFKYKWRFVAQQVKENPDSQLPWFVQRCQCGWKFLTLKPEKCPKCGDVPVRPYG